MGRYEEITDEAPAAAAGGRYEEVSNAGPKLDPRGREYDPRFAPSAEDDAAELAPSSSQVLARKIKGGNSYASVMDAFARQGRAARGEPEPHGLADIVTGKAGQPTTETPGKGKAFALGGAQGVTFGFGDELAAAGEAAVSQVPGVRNFFQLFQKAGYPDISDPSLSYQERRDAYRRINKQAEEAHPVAYGGGEVVGGLITAPLAPGGAAVKGGAKAAAASAAKFGGVTGFAQGVGSSEGDLTQGEFGKVFRDAGISGLTGMGVGAALGGIGGSLVARAEQREAATLMKGIASGEGKAGRATVKAAKLLDRGEENAVSVLRENKDLAKVAAKPAKEALPVFEQHMDDVGAKLDPLYAIKDKATGGVSLVNLANFLDDEAAKLAKDPLNEQYVKAVEGIKNSLLKAWAPELGEKLAGNAKAKAAGLLDGPVFKNLEDVMVPTRDVRKVVTRLQKRGTDVINALNPGESSQMKADMAKMMKGFIDADLEIAAENSPKVAKAVAEIQQINKEYSALATMHTAIEQRGWKEATGAVSGGGHVSKLFKHGGALAAVPMLLHGNIAGAAAAAVGPHLLPYAGKAANAANAALARANRSDTLLAQTILRLIEAGIPRAAAISMAQAAHGGGVVDVGKGALQSAQQ